ncbi:glutathione S-transferase [Irpex rosettiformis]|uniref:Glutathione S-transferase n=1 Tax=Irpex rosettiformis TaxID=378272 RepID=A0ACB8TSH6_9APHY|nr:glutathione S-transferase [Irpex rosettiformis]
MAHQSDKPIVLYTGATPNGHAPAILLEELKAAYGIPDYEAVKMSMSDADIGKVHNQVKSPWFTENINPNGRIPAITHKGQRVFETSAILVYLAQIYDKDRKFSKDPVKEPGAWAEEQSWLFFAHGGIGPMEGQAGHFALFAKDKIPYAIDRYINEVKRLFSVLDKNLSTREYIAGPDYGIADIKTFPWVRMAPRVGIELVGEYPHIQKWIEKIEARPAVKEGLTIPKDTAA